MVGAGGKGLAGAMSMVRTSRRGVAMVSTTLDFAEKYLLKTEVRTVAVMPDDDDSVRDDDSYDA